MKNILITGGAGFIGSELVRYLIKKNLNVINIDKLTYSGNLDNLANVSSNRKYKFFNIMILFLYFYPSVKNGIIVRYDLNMYFYLLLLPLI